MTSAYLRELEKFESGDGHYHEDFYGQGDYTQENFGIFDTITDPVKTLVNNITGPVKNTIVGIEDKVKGTVENVIGAVKGEFNVVKNGFVSLKTKIENGAHDLEQKAMEVASKVVENVENLVSKEVDDIENSALVKKGVDNLIKKPLHNGAYALPIAGLFGGAFVARFFPGAEFIDGYLEKNTTWYVKGLFSLLIIMVITFMIFSFSYRIWYWSSTDPKEDKSATSFLVNTVIAPFKAATTVTSVATQAVQKLK